MQLLPCQRAHGLRKSRLAALPHASGRVAVPLRQLLPSLLAGSRGSSLVARSVEFGGVTKEEAEKFDRIAASLVARLGMVADHELEEEENMVEFGADIEEVETAQARVNERQRSPPSSSGAGFADTPARNKRKRQIPTDALPKVAIVGRPNVGKSALFNRLAGSSLAVVYDQPGITRDRLYTRAFWGMKEYVLIDTGGLMSDATKLPPDVQLKAMKEISEEGLPSAIERQAAAGVAEADVVLVLADGQAGLQSGDREVVMWLRQTHPSKPILLGVNKCENSQKADLMASEFWELGLQPHAVSAINGTGTGELLDQMMALLPPPKSLDQEDATDRPLAVAIVGRPNVGKSSLLNAICGEERSIVCDMSGTTRDAVDTQITLPSGQKLTLIDTAGIRKRSKVADAKDGSEQLSVDRALRAVRRADVAVLVVDASEGVTQQDFRLSEMFAKEGKAVVLVVNKWDKVDPLVWTMEKMVENVQTQLREVGWANVVCTTANKGRKVEDVVKGILEAGTQHRRRITTATLNMVVKEAVAFKSPPTQRALGGRKGKLYYATQAGSQPPTFVLFVNDPKLFPDDYRRYVERSLRANIGFPGTPLRLLWRGKPERENSRPDRRGDGEGANNKGSYGAGGSGGGARGPRK